MIVEEQEEQPGAKSDELSGDGQKPEQNGVKPGEVAPIDESLRSEHTVQNNDLLGVEYEHGTPV